MDNFWSQYDMVIYSYYVIYRHLYNLFFYHAVSAAKRTLLEYLVGNKMILFLHFGTSLIHLNAYSLYVNYIIH
jgi:hypothetical protein